MPAPAGAPDNPALEQHLDEMTRMRMHGASPEEITSYYAAQTANLRAHGVGEDEIRAYYGGMDPAPMHQNITQTVQQNQNSMGHTSWLDLFTQGLTNNSSVAALLGAKPIPYQGQGGMGGAVASALGETAGDLPISVGSAFWSGKGTTLALAKVPGLGETPAPEVAGGLTGAFNAGAGPQLIKSARDQWLAAGHQGWSAADFLQAHGVNAQAAVEAGKMGVASTVAEGVGGAAETALARAGVKGIAASGAKVASEATAFTAASATLHGQMPQAQDWVEGVVIMAAAHGAARLSGSTMRAWRGRLQQYYSTTGVDPVSAANQAAHDPVLMRQLAGEPAPPPRPGSSRTPTGPTHPALNPTGAPHPDQFVVPRVAGDFDTAVNFTLEHEGGKEVIDTNQRSVKWGINAADNPGVDVDHLTREGAAEIYKAKYWDAIGADSLPPNMRQAAFDTAVVEGVGRAKQWLSESGNDPQVFLEKRAAFEAKLARENPAKYGRFAEVWAKRVRDLGGNGAATDILGKDPTDPLTPEQMALLDNEGQPPEKPPEEPPHRENEPQPEGEPIKYEDALEHVSAHVADASSGDGWIAGGLKAAQQLYKEIFSVEHPINRLTNAVLQGAPLDDAANPMIMRRLAERSQEDGRYAINGDGHGNIGKMIDMQGNPTGGKSLAAIVDAVGDANDRNRFERGYLTARWARQMHSAGKETGLDPKMVEALIEHEEAGGVMPEGENLDEHIQRRGIGLEVGSKRVDQIGPHYNRKTNTIHMPDEAQAARQAEAYRGLTLDEVKAHELGHALARGFGEKIGEGDWTHLSEQDQERINDDLIVASRRFRPEFWKRGSGQTEHVSKPSELIADGIATWLTDPVARTRMPDFERVMRGAGVDVEKELGAKPEKWGTPFQQAADEITDYRNGTLRWLRDSGVINSETFRTLVSDKEFSAPGYRDLGNGKWGPAQASKGNVFNPLRAATGSERQVLPMLHSLMKETILRRQLAATNIANTTLANAGIGFGVAHEERAVDFNVVKTLGDLHQIDAEHNIEGLGDLSSQLAKSAGAAVPRDAMPVMRDGKMFAVKFNDDYKDVVPIVRGYDQNTQSLFFKIAAGITAIPRTLQTVANPAFSAHILGLDVMFQHLVNPDARNVLSSLVTGYGAAVRDPEGYDQWLRQGGAEHVFDHMSKNDYLKSVFKGDQQEGLLAGAWNAPQTAWHALQAWNRVNFAALRYGRFRQGLMAGESTERAAAASTESAYHRVGFGGQVLKAINAVMPFTSARMNGLEKTVRALMGGAPEVLSGGKLQNRTILGTKYSFAQTAIRSVAMLTVPAMISWLAFKDQEWYKAMPDWQKNNAWFVIPPIDGKTPPIPFGAPAPLLSAIFIGLPRMLAQSFLEDDPHAFDHWGGSAAASLLGPVALPTASVFEPVVEHITNHSFFRDQPLASPDAVKTVGTPEQFNHYSSAEAKALSRIVGGAGGLSPVVIDNYIRQWGGIAGAVSQTASNMVGDATSANQRPEAKPWELPPFSSYIERYPSASAQPIIDYYNRADKLESVHNSIVRLMKEGDLAGVQALAEQNPNAAAYHALRLQGEDNGIDPTPYLNALQGASDKADWNDLSLIKQGQDAMKAANQYVNNVYNNPRLTAQDKRQMLDLAFQQMQGISEQINDAMDRAHLNNSRPSSHQAPPPDSIQWQQPADLPQ